MIGTPAAARRDVSRFGPWLSAAGVAILGLWVSTDLLGRVFKSGGAWAESLVDHRLIYDGCRSVLLDGQYPKSFPYPPSAIIVLAPLVAPPYSTAATLWQFGLGLCAVGCWLILANLFGWSWRRGYYLALPVAHVTCTYFVQWDLRSANCNLFVLLALILSVRSFHRRSDGACGIWLALAVSLKLYSIPVLAYYAWNGRRRAVVATFATLVVVWVVAPFFVFGPEKTFRVYEGWVANLRDATDAARLADHPILTSLDRAGLVLAGERGQRWFPRVGKLVWAGVFLLAWRLAVRRGKTNDPNALLADVSVFAILPVAISPYLEPYHAVPFVLPAAVLISTAIDGHQRLALRWFAWLAFILTWAVMRVPIDWLAKGLLINVKLAGGVVAAGLVAHWRLTTASGDSEPIRATDDTFTRLTRPFRIRTTAG